jgi:hypothetical protein
MLSFAQPLFLLALGGLAIPFLIHRISRARPVAWNFPSISRIRKTPLPRQGKRAISDWLLLLLRTLILALFILALAGPVWTPGEETGVAQDRPSTRAVVLLDYSSSMSGWGAVDEAREILRELDGRPDTRWGWLVADTEILAEYPLQDGPSGESSISTLIEFLETTSPSASLLNPQKALLRSLDLLETATGPLELHIISDFQESNWSEPLLELPESVTLQLHRVGMNDRDRNLALQDVIVVPVDRQRLRVIGRAMNFGSRVSTTNIRLTAGNTTHTRETRLEPGSSVPVAFEIERPEGSPEATMELDPAIGDPYPRDDGINFAATSPPALEVLALDPGSAVGSSNEETFFLEQALDTGPDTEWLRYSLLTVGLFAVNPETLARTTAVFVPASAFGDPSIPWDTLSAYIESGGLVVATMDQDAVRGIQGLRSAGFPAGDYRGLAGRAGSERFFVGPIPENSPLASVFEGDAGRDLHLMSIRRHIRLQSPEEAIVMLQTEEAEPLLVRFPRGRGALVLSAFPWDRSASDFPLRPSFLPVVREVFALANRDPNALPGLRKKTGIPVAESLTTFVSPADLRARLQESRQGELSGRARVDARLSGDGSSVPFAHWLLVSALFALIAESLLARRLITPA